MENSNKVLRLLRAHFPYLTFSVQELNEIERRGGHLLVHTNDDEVCGYLVIDTKIPKGEPVSYHKDCLYLAYMGTKKKYRGMGIGRGLLRRAKIIADENRKSLYTYVASFNVKEMNLLYSEGFKAIKKIYMFKQDWIELEYKI